MSRHPFIHNTTAYIGSVRTIRAQIIRLRYDHKEVMAHIEKGIHAHFAGLQSSAAGSTPTSSTNGLATEASEIHPPAAGTSVLTPFAKVNSVVPGSPAGQAGLQAGDLIRSFGTVNWLNHERLSKVAEFVQQNEGVSYRWPLQWPPVHPGHIRLT